MNQRVIHRPTTHGWPAGTHPAICKCRSCGGQCSCETCTATQAIERCLEVAGGSIGCTTLCTKTKGHEGPCAWDAYEQLEWNKRAEASR